MAELSLRELAEALGAELHGDPGVRVSRIATLEAAGSTELTFLANARYRRFLPSTTAAAVLLRGEDRERCPVNALVVKDPYVAYAKAAALLNPVQAHTPGVDPTAVVHPSARLGPGVFIGPHCVVGAAAIIGADVYLGPACIVEAGCEVGEASRFVARVTLCAGTVVGRRALLHPGVVLGSDGFGHANDGGRWIKVPQLGRVIVGDDVEIGANTTVDRGALDDTRIEDGVKLDNLIQVAHNVVIGAHTAIAGCVGIAGSARIGRHCAIGGGVGIAGHLEIADRVQITAMSLVTRSIPESGVYSSGTPLQENAQWHRNFVRFKQLDDMAKRLKHVEQALGERPRKMIPNEGEG